MRKLSNQGKLLSMNSLSPIDSSSWVINIRNFFAEKEREDEITGVNNTYNEKVYVCSVPKSLRALKPETYSPQIIALGPYNHLRQDLLEMETHKIFCAKMLEKDSKNLKFMDLVNKLWKEDDRIRGCYNKYLEMNGETLAWIMAIDGLFLLEILHLFVNRNNSFSSSITPKKSLLGNSIGTKLSYVSILNDIMMLENQIPIFVLEKIVREKWRSSSDLDENMLAHILICVCKELSPLVIVNENYTNLETMKSAHLLDLLYQLMVPKIEQGNSEDQELQEEQEEPSKDVVDNQQEDITTSFAENKEILIETWSMLKAIKGFSKFLSLKPLKMLATFPIKAIIKLPIIESIIESKEINKGKGITEKIGEETILVEEIMIPSVKDLYNVGVQFCPTNGDISNLRFDKRLKIFYLPIIRVDGTTEVIMRNLIAFEASTSSHLVLARFSELMNGIIDTSKDVEILRKNKILTSRLRKDEEVANLWNGMTKAIKLSKVPFIDEAIKEVNGYYNSTFKVKSQKLMRRYVYNSWRILVVLATLLLLGLMSLQSFCTVYSCPRFFNMKVATSSSNAP